MIVIVYIQCSVSGAKTILLKLQYVHLNGLSPLEPTMPRLASASLDGWLAAGCLGCTSSSDLTSFVKVLCGRSKKETNVSSVFHCQAG